MKHPNSFDTTEEAFNKGKFCQICGNAFELHQTRTVIPHRAGGFIIVCEGDENCPISKQPKKPKSGLTGE